MASAGIFLRRSLLGVVLLTLVVACNRKTDEREVVTFWAMGYEGEVVAQLIPEFEAQNPGIKVNLQQLPWLSAHEKLLTAFAGESLPDVSPIGNTWIPEFSALGALEPLDDEIAATPGFDAPDYFPGVWDSGVVDGKTYAVPWYVETRLPFYRTDLLKQAGIAKPPCSWDEWRKALHAVKREVGAERYAILLPLNEFEPLLSLAIQQPEPLLRDGGRYGNFRSAGFRHALGFYKEMFDQKLAPMVTNNQISNVWDEFGKGFYSFYISGPWNIAKFKERLPPQQQDDWMTMPLPGPNGPGASLANGTSFVVFRQSRHKAAAWKLIRFLSTPETQAKFHALTGDLPPRRSPWRTPALANDRYAKAFREQLERAVATPKVPEWERIAQELRVIGEEVANGRMDVDQAAEEMDRRADRFLAKRRWMLDRKVIGQESGLTGSEISIATSPSVLSWSRISLLPPGEGPAPYLIRDGAQRRIRDAELRPTETNSRSDCPFPHPPSGHLLPEGEGKHEAVAVGWGYS